MTEVNRADTKTMHDTADAIQTAHRDLEANRQSIEESMERIQQLFQEPGTQQILKRLSARWMEANMVLNKKLLDLGVIIGQAGSDIDKAVSEGRDELAGLASKFEGKYNGQLNL